MSSYEGDYLGFDLLASFKKIAAQAKSVFTGQKQPTVSTSPVQPSVTVEPLPPLPKKSMVPMLVLIAGAGAGAWFFMKKKKGAAV